MRPFALLLLFVLAASSSAQKEVYRKASNPMGAFFGTISPTKRAKKDALLKRYPKDNKSYTKGVLALLSPAEKVRYFAVVKAMMTDFLKSRPDVDPARIEIFGGYGIHVAKPKSKV